MIIDVRCRYTAGAAASYYRAALAKSGRLPLIRSVNEGTEEAFFSEIAEAGITTAVSASGFNPGARLGKYDFPDRLASNDVLADVQARNPARFVAVGGIDVSNQFHDGLAEIQRCKEELSVNIFNVEPGRAPGCNPDDERLFPFYRQMEKQEGVLILQTSGLKGGQYLNYAHPDRVERIAEHFPGLNIVCAHGCYPYVREAIVIAMRRSNVWLSPEGYLWHLGHEDWLRAINKNFENFSSRFLFGTAYPLTPIKPFVENFLALDWKTEFLPRMLYMNALEALRLKGTGTFDSFYGTADENRP
ncbi:hypothetical protein E2A64_16695 [Pseudohoeflea suaedae]|uniref:Amidohydrolase-related domain-containing protein n=1 Tax=Pseudohoeflea suaedae TaxID=877384 RepID=A0A4V3A6U1_9HYPH|nr:amidohydrolase family protein [Pseudohoeflea suaedae]TDH34309.1 hypothetical protein E2A64_16695 [Pseudohoeflea suaedae]